MIGIMGCYSDKSLYRMVKAPAMYRRLPGNPNLVYTAVCRALSGHRDRADWSAFSKADWSLMLVIAANGRVAPLLHEFFSGEADGYGCPSEVRQQLSRARYETVARNALYFKRLDQITERLSRRGIPVIPLKGAALDRTLYPKTGLRPMADLDILVPRQSVDEALAVVTECGFHEKEAEKVINRLAGHHLCLRGGEHDLERIEIHWTLGYVRKEVQPRLEKWLWEQANRSAFDGGWGRLIFSLSPTATLLTLAAHLGDLHRTRHLLWIYDIHLLISREGLRIDWEEVAARADEFRWWHALRASLVDARYHFGTAIPGGLLSAIDQDVATGRIHQLQDLEGSRTPVSTLRILTQLPWRKRVWLFLISVFPGRQTMIVRYKPDPTWLWPLFYLVRWFGFAWKSLRSARELLRS